MSKTERLDTMKRLYCQRSFSDGEMSERLGVDRSTVYRCRIELEREHPFVVEDGRYRIDRRRYISNVRLNMVEALSLYLAARRASQQTRFAHVQTASALEKVATSLHQPMTEKLVGAAERILHQRSDPQRTAVFETVAQAWVENLQLRLDYRPLNAPRTRTHRFDPYLLEPSPWSDSVYVIGHSDLARKVITLKLERIERAMLSGPFAPPENFDEQRLLEHAWGIWGSAGPPQRVTLRFGPGIAAQRLKETIWHPLERITPTDDGGCVWETEVAEWREMLPWIRGWGAEVEVIGPDDLRELQIFETGRLAHLYRLTSSPPAHMLFWAKTGDNGSTHPLLWHLIDVGQVALALWENGLTDAFRNQIAEALDLDPSAAGRLFAFWAACHDIGKASPNFQRKYKPAQPGLEKAGFVFPPLMGKTNCYHATVSALLLPRVLIEATGLDEEMAREVAQALGGHHGSWPTADVRRSHKGQLGDPNWQSAQRALLDSLTDLFAPPAVTRLGRDDAERGAMLVLLSGLTSVADWIGSMEEYFVFSSPNVGAETYAPLSAQRALRALRTLGWLDWQPPQDVLPFEALHGFAPRPAQQAVIDLLPGDTEPTLVIAEMLTGSGKTELALYLADRWAVLRQQRGLYVAMPTQATSNQMFGRVGQYLRKRYPEQQINFHLVHSAARWRTELLIPEFSTEDDETAQGTIKAQSWFLPHKRTLLAPFAVGTVDQALMSTLQTRHFFVRLFGLSGKTVIFDEVHAYDTYMNSLFTRLLLWLRAVGASVIVLSATLPAKTRQKLVAAWRGSDEGGELMNHASYPSVTVASQNQLSIESLPEDGERRIAVEWIEPAVEALVETLRDRLNDGGCVAIICNRVQRAQDIYRALQEADLVADDELLLFHARTPRVWRDETEQAVINRFGKDTAQRPHKSIVVATQVIEQSLDLDFDLMVTDLAPIDLILQRAGRLHRHDRPNRPVGLETATLLIVEPERTPDGTPDFGGDAWVYEPYVLLRSLWTIQANGSDLRLPAQTVALIEAVYGDETEMPADLPADAVTLLRKASEQMTKNEDKARFEASNRLAPTPECESLLWRESDLLEEDRPEIHASLQAMTRLMRPTISLVCLHGEPDANLVALDQDGAPQVDLIHKPSPEVTRDLAQRIVTVSHPALLHHFVAQDVPSGWRDHTLLHTHRAVVFHNGAYRIEGTKYLLRLSQGLGLEIIKLGEEQAHS